MRRVSRPPPRDSDCPPTAPATPRTFPPLGADLSHAQPRVSIARRQGDALFPITSKPSPLGAHAGALL
eukprot:2022850-Alexandrium_andersonii.AAC.1